MKLKSFIIIYFVILSFNSYPFSCEKNEKLYFVKQSQREIPLINSVDIVIIGGTTSAVSAAVAASRQGASVFLIAPKPYLGEDMCGTLRLRIDKSRTLNTDLEKSVFQDSFQTTPMQVKATLAKALIKANVDFIFSSFVTDIIWDNNNIPSGIVIANRAGRQAVKAKVIIDATDRAWVCRMTGAKFYNWKGEAVEFQRNIIIPGENDSTPDYITHKLEVPMSDFHYSSFANAEIVAREKTYREDQLRASESLFHIPPDPIICKKNADYWENDSEIDIKHFQVEGHENLFVLSGSADIPRAVADSLLKPAAMIEIASIIGEMAAKYAKQKKTIVNKLYFKTHLNSNDTILQGDINDLQGDVREILKGLRPISNIQQTIRCPAMYVPVLGNYDVVVVGGGTAGAPAAIAAGRSGMKVLVVEYLEGLGGIGTLGMIGKPYYGQRVGFAAEVPFPKDNIEPKMEWYRSEIKKAGGDIWLGVLGVGVYIDSNIVKGVAICTPEGRGVITADVVIDATSNADIAIAAGAGYMYADIEKGDIAIQGTGLSSRPLEGNYYNSDYLLVDEADMVDIWNTLVSVQIAKASENVYDIVPIIQNRERRRVVGDYILTYVDQMAERTFPDAIVFSGSDYDSHGYPSSFYFALLPHDEISRKKNHPAPGGTCFTPYRCLLPKNLDGILVVGLGISMDRDASALIRMQHDIANQGYAAGIAAMLAITNKVALRNINIRELQKILIEKGNIPDSVLNMEDSFPLSKEVIALAVESYGEATNPESASKPLAIIMSHKEVALPLIKIAHENAVGRSKLLYAQVLGIFGHKEGVPTLLSYLKNFTEWDEKIYQGSMADYAHLPTPMDQIILALGYSGDKSCLPILLQWTDKLDTTITLSHHRSVALALERISDSSAAKHLADVLQKRGMQGYAMTQLKDVFTVFYNDCKGINTFQDSFNKNRTNALREIVLARALYRCGDYKGLGKSILENYRKDMRGILARHANQILNNGVLVK